MAGFDGRTSLRAMHEIALGKHLHFGRNWACFLLTLDEERIRRAEDTLCAMPEVENLAGRSLLNVGSGPVMRLRNKRHSRTGGNPVCSSNFLSEIDQIDDLDSRLRGNDDVSLLACHITRLFSFAARQRFSVESVAARWVK